MIDTVVSIENVVTWVIFLGSAAFEIFALADAAIRPAQEYVNAGKLNKPGWLVILFVALLTCLAFRSPLGIFGLLGLLAAAVYVADVRPLVAVRHNRR